MSQDSTDEQDDWIHQVCGFKPEPEYPTYTSDELTPDDDAAPHTTSSPSGPAPALLGPVAGLTSQAAEDAAEKTLAEQAAAPVAEEAGGVTLEEAIGGTLGATIAGLAAGAAILFHSTPTAPAWADEMNPETGQPYKNQKEYEDVSRRQSDPQASRRTRQTPDPAPDVIHSDEQNAEDVLRDVTEEPGPNENDCDAITGAIKDLIKRMHSRQLDLISYDGGDNGHRKRFEKIRKLLRDLIDIARGLGDKCPINLSEAEEAASLPTPPQKK